MTVINQMMKMMIHLVVEGKKEKEKIQMMKMRTPKMIHSKGEGGKENKGQGADARIQRQTDEGVCDQEERHGNLCRRSQEIRCPVRCGLQ